MRKKNNKWSSLACCFVLATGYAAAANEAENLVENPGFEVVHPYTVPEKLKDLFVASEIPDNWGPNPNNPTKLVIVSDAEASHGGSNSVKIEPIDSESKATSALAYSTRFKVLAGDKYSLSVWAKGEGKLILMCYAFEPQDVAIPAIGGDRYRAISSTEWAEQKIEFTIPEGVESVAPAFHIQGIVTLDDVTFQRVAP
ncbi:MAG: carbohydrate binding domain-containing protein [Phycisphaerae bacterium]